jgi:Flp pilus assembly protein TadG
MRSLLNRFHRDERGLAYVEFAFIGPILLFVTLAGLELVNYALAYLRVKRASG